MDKAYDKVMDINIGDMSQRRQDLQDLQVMKGLAADHPIRAEGDGRYNNPIGSGAHYAGQAATQIAYTIIKGESTDRQVLNVWVGNKLCHKGKLLKRKGVDVQCPGHEGCTANLPAGAVIGDEKTAAGKCIESMGDTRLNIGSFTSDGDSHALMGIAEKQPDVNIAACRDTVHYKKTHKFHIINREFSNTMFPQRTVQVRNNLKKRFASDLSLRCANELKAAEKKLGHDLQKLIPAMSRACMAITSCYQGDCSMCERYSFACNGKDGDQWRKPMMPQNFPPFKMTANDISEMIFAIHYRFGEKGLNLTKYQTNSNKAESVNRAINRTCSKDITMSRNFGGAVHAAVLDVNEGRANALIMKAEAIGAPITRGSKVAGQLLSDDQIGRAHV
jgi:hypothetical protein